MMCQHSAVHCDREGEAHNTHSEQGVGFYYNFISRLFVVEAKIPLAKALAQAALDGDTDLLIKRRMKSDDVAHMFGRKGAIPRAHRPLTHISASASTSYHPTSQHHPLTPPSITR